MFGVLMKCALLLIALNVARAARHRAHSPRIRLDDVNEWIVTNRNGSIQVQGTVPGGIYSDLTHEGIIPSFYEGYNDILTRWVGLDEWTYTVNYELTNRSFLNKNEVTVTFFGLDTVATIFVNDVQVGSVDNMFVRYTFNIKPLITSNKLKVQVRFMSPIREAARRFRDEKLRRGIGVPPLCNPSTYKGECHINHLRKMQASFGWDWGPAIPSVGIWKDVLLEAYNTAIIRDVRFSSEPLNRKHLPPRDTQPLPWVVNVTICLEGRPGRSLHGAYDLRLIDDNVAVWHSTNNGVNFVVGVDGTYEIHVVAVIDKHIRAWWPNEMGPQQLYRLEVDFISRGEQSRKVIQVGFRTVELVQTPVDSRNPAAGLLFFFKINGVPMFMKGSNWIPSNILPEIADTERGRQTVRKLLEASRDAHMNMLRVWGGGVYESDFFYEMCDRLGIMIWQDFMFACALYPTNAEYLGSVETEITQQMNRLQHRASIVVWAGNNENEQGLRQNWYQTALNYSLYRDDYLKLYVDVIKRIVERLDRSRSYVVSSPSNGLKTDRDGFISANPTDSRFGDVHFYEYDRDTWREETFPTPRFASEYGLQALPNWDTWLEVTARPERDLIYLSDFLRHRQHSTLGFEPINYPISTHFPDVSLNGTDGFKRYIYYSQLHHAMSMKVETEKYRRYRNAINTHGEGGTMGALYWQFNDVWPAPSLSGIDSNGRYRMLQYFARRFFAPVLVVAAHLNDHFEVSVISDRLEDINNVALNIYTYKWDSFEAVSQVTWPINVTRNSATMAYRTNLDTFLNKTACNRRTCFLYVTMTRDGAVESDNFLLPIAPRFVQTLKDPHLQVDVYTSGSAYTLRIFTRAIALFVWLETIIPGTFSDNGFVMVTSMRDIEFYPDVRIDVDALKQSLRITSLR